ncbi:peroxiredoxin [Sphingomonas sp.]|jgi:peroxiredoxin Q/BCP|uniref:peroxiredoxin n=1 Tax=Sphingomonas sp. TaxID=28214 RepID=UPI002DEC4A8D|nr:peroxiredoxin [Sphingomonas sp.]
MVTVGDQAPDVAFEGPDGQQTSLAAWRGKPLVLYFYPKDDTSGCTKEAQDFTELAGEFASAGVALLGMSKDSAKKHKAFTEKYGLKVPLATDAEGKLLEAFGAWVEKSMYGRKYMGIDRSTFLIDKDGRIAAEWRKVKVPGHAKAVLEAARAL